MNKLIRLHKENNHTTDKWGETEITHTYLAVYGEIFARLKDENNKILEIGIGMGDSLNLWAEYFTQSIIYGIDHDLPQIRNVSLYDNIRVIGVRDAYIAETVNLLRDIGKFNIIIDDGSHWLFHQKYVIDNYCSLLTDDGILVIEDVSCDVDAETKMRYVDMLVAWFPEDLREHVYLEDRRRVNNNMADSLVIYDKYGKKGRNNM